MNELIKVGDKVYYSPGISFEDDYGWSGISMSGIVTHFENGFTYFNDGIGLCCWPTKLLRKYPTAKTQDSQKSSSL